MSRLLNKTKDQLLVLNLRKAKNLKQKMLGLIGSHEIKDTEAFWISSFCPSIHTFFMSYPIDVIFTDKNFQILSLFKEVKPWKVLWGGFKSWNVFEMKAGQIQKKQIQTGEFLYVES